MQSKGFTYLNFFDVKFFCVTYWAKGGATKEKTIVCLIF